MFLVSTRNFPPELGGMQNLMGGLAEALINHGPVKVFADKTDDCEKFDKLSKVEIERFGGINSDASDKNLAANSNSVEPSSASFSGNQIDYLINGFKFARHEKIIKSIAEEIGYKYISCSYDICPMLNYTSRGYTTSAITVNATNASGTSTDIKSVQVIVVR